MMRSPKKIIMLYQLGHLTKMEMFTLFTENIDEKNVSELICSLTPQLLKDVKDYIDRCPHTDEKWSKLKTFHMGSFVGRRSPEEVEVGRAQETRLQRQGVAILRDCIGPYPVRPLPGLETALSAWNGRCIEKLAKSIYDDGDFAQERMAVLGDAMEDAGGTDAALLEHLRGAGAHFRCCWAIDLLTGRT